LRQRAQERKANPVAIGFLERLDTADLQHSLPARFPRTMKCGFWKAAAFAQ